MTTEDYIFIGYDGYYQCHWAMHDGSLIRIDDSDNPRLSPVLNGLCAVGTWLPRQHQLAVVRRDGTEVIVIIQQPWQVRVDYSDQAWCDLLEVGRLV